MPREPVQPVVKTDKAVDKIQDLISKEQFWVRQGEKQPPQEAASEQFTKQIPSLIQRTLAKLDAAAVYQTFKLPGRDYMVKDRRDRTTEPKSAEAKETIAEESKKPIEELLIHRGKLISAKEKSYENYLKDVSSAARTPEQKAAAERLAQLFSRFERMLLKRFEQGAVLEQPVANGRFQFLAKTLEQWRAFFARFAQRTVLRRVAAEQIQEMVFRGLVQRAARATVISDLSLTGGGLEKFARTHLSPESRAFLAWLNNLQPGQRVGPEDLRRFLTGELEYLAIKNAEEQPLFPKAPEKGKFLTTAQAEEKIANDLGLQLGEQLREKEKILRDLDGRKRGFPGGGGGLFGEEEGSSEPQTQFVPWWQYGSLKKFRTPLRWFLFACLVGLVGLILAGLF